MNTLDLTDKVVLVLGASRGIGAATVAEFAACGAKLVLGSRDRSGMEDVVRALARSTQAQIKVTDITKAEDLEALVRFALESFGRLDIAVNNAGVSQKRFPFADTPDEIFDATFTTNVRGTFIAMKHEIKAMQRSGGGSIVNVGSISALTTMPRFSCYGASKAALISLTKGAALDHAGDNIRVNLVAPGAVDTFQSRSGILGTEQGRTLVNAKVPMHRVSEPVEIARTIVWLASPASSYTTGTVLPIDGGYIL